MATNKLALVAGIGFYKGRWPALQNCKADADEIAETLTFPEYGFTVDKLIDAEVTKAAIFRWLVEARNSGAQKLLFYFAGHGVVNDLGSFLVTYDNQEFDEGISLSSLMSITEPESGTETEVIILLDCCHSGEAVTAGKNSLSGRQITNTDISQEIRRSDPSAVVIAACAAEQKALEATNLGHGIFTYHLLNAMCGDAADHTGAVTVHSLYEVVSREMSNREGGKQDPVFGGRVRGRMILGTGFTPVLAPPRPEQEYERIEVEARDHLDQYNQFRSTWNVETWRTDGYFAACRRLEQINTWFDRKDQIEGLANREDYRRSKSTLLRYQSELGVVEADTRTRWGILGRPIGAGGFGRVWLIRESSDRLLAYKLYHSNELHDREKVKRFKNGYEAMRMLNHPRIVNVHDYSDCPPGFIMDYVEGENLRDLGIGSFMEVIDIIRILGESAEAIQDAHLSKVIHRDIKPENIVCQLDENGIYRPYLTDFDLAWFSTQTQKATKTAMGVVYYAAPEQYVAFDPKAVRSRTPTLDVYSFGQLMYFCFTNRDPEPLNTEENIQRLSHKLLQSCSAITAKSIIDLYRKCTLFGPTKRLQGFAEIISVLGEVSQQLTHTDNGGAISREGYSAELAYQITRELPRDSVTSFLNSSRTWQISLEWKDSSSSRKNPSSILSMYIKPTDRVSLENVSNDKMRTILNRRIDNALSPYSSQGQRHPGRRGDFEFYLEWRPNKLTRTDALILCDALRSVLSNLQNA